MTRLSLIVLRTSNLETMLPFYQAIGLTFAEEKHGSGPVHYACEQDGLVVELYPGEAGSAPNIKSGGATMIGFIVESLDTVLTALAQMEVHPVSPPKSSSWGRQCTVLDPDGRSISLSEPNPS
jgi:predicted enzyme related to lactoylglutathione lyase